MIFEERMREILAERRDDDLKITIAKDLPGETVGYGLSVIRDNIGEVCTLFVRKGYRSLGLGKNIMKRHMGWLREKGCHEIVVYVLPENKNTLSFYEGCGFRQNIIKMQIPKNDA